MAKKEHNKDKKLHNFPELLHNLRNFDELTQAQKGKILSTSLQDLVIEQDLEAYEQEAEQRDLERRKVEALEGFLQLDREESPAEPDNQLSFTKVDLEQYVAYRTEGLAPKSQDWIYRESKPLWDCTQGEISAESMKALRDFTLNKYSSIDSRRKVLGFAAAFLKFLARIRVDPRYNSFEDFLGLPKTVKVRKAITERIITRKEIESFFERIETTAKNGKIDARKTRNYRAHALLAAYTGLRPSTIQRLKVGQLRAAIKEKKPTLHVLAEQEKNRVEHYVPLHPAVVRAINEVLADDFKEKTMKYPSSCSTRLKSG